MRLIASDLALRIITALRHTGPASLARLAEVLRVRPSSCQRALEVVLADGLVTGIGEGRARVYMLEEKNHALAAVEAIAETLVPAQEALVIVGNANPAVELIGVTSGEVITVLAKRSTTTDRAHAVEAIKKLADALKLAPQFFDHQDLVRARDLTVQLRHELSRGEVLVGHLDRSIPDRSGHRKTAGRALGHVSPALHLPSDRTLRSIKRRHGVRRLKLFGSAVRTDFRPDSDVDIAVTLDAGLRSDRASLEALEAELERRLGHDVDLVLESELRPPVRYLVDKESVAL
jgi:predicted nucleotidyltransferase